MGTTESILQFALAPTLGLNRYSSDEDIKDALGEPDYEYDLEDSPYMLYQSLEIGLIRKSELVSEENRKVSYFKFCVNAQYPYRSWPNYKRFLIPGVIDQRFTLDEMDLRSIVQTLVNHSVWFEHIDHFYRENEFCGIRTLDKEKQFHFAKKKERWLLDSYYSNEI